MNYFKLIFQSMNEGVSYLQEIIDQHEFANVVVYNDNINDFDNVVSYLYTSIPGMTSQKARKLTNKIQEVHYKPQFIVDFLHLVERLQINFIKKV